MSEMKQVSYKWAILNQLIMLTLMLIGYIWIDIVYDEYFTQLLFFIAFFAPIALLKAIQESITRIILIPESGFTMIVLIIGGLSGRNAIFEMFGNLFDFLFMLFFMLVVFILKQTYELLTQDKSKLYIFVIFFLTFGWLSSSEIISRECGDWSDFVYTALMVTGVSLISIVGQYYGQQS